MEDTTPCKNLKHKWDFKTMEGGRVLGDKNS